MSRHTVAVAALACLATACGDQLVDPCAGSSGTCVALYVDDSPSIDTIDIQLVGPSWQFDRRRSAPKGAALSPPLAVALLLADSLVDPSANIDLTITGSIGGTNVGAASASTMVAKGGRAVVHVTLRAATDLGVDASGPDSVLFADPANAKSVDAWIPTYAGPRIALVSPETELMPMPMQHATSAIPASASSSCSNCHVGAGSGAYYPGKLHASLAALSLLQPTTCADCHATTMPTGFVGPLAVPARSPPSGEMKHDAVVWLAGSPTATPILAVDCGVCHRSPSPALAADWATATDGSKPARFHSALTAVGATQPTSCIDCHANSRPTGIFTSSNSTVPANVQLDHGTVLSDCVACHSSTSTWSGGQLHPVGSTTPASCLPCHSGERPTSTSGWKSTSYTSAPFDYTGSAGLTHGNGLDCVSCHNGPGAGAWGSSQDWRNGHFAHSGAAASCIACHDTQRPATVVSSFDHTNAGNGDCGGCHQATVTAGAYAALADWSGGISYPGSALVGSAAQFGSATVYSLQRSNGAIVGVTSVAAILYNQMLHVSSALPASLAAGPSSSPNLTTCWHCHTNSNGTVTSYLGGSYHPSLASYRATPAGAVSALPQPTKCGDCHISRRPVGIVEKGSNLVPMDHAASFVSPVLIGGVSAGGVSAIDCGICHHSPGVNWNDGVFHANIASAVPSDCAGCHYRLSQNSGSDVSNGGNWAMRHSASALPTQRCDSCHHGALANATMTPLASLWTGAKLHAGVATQPTVCIECHVGSIPANATQSSASYTLAKGGTGSNSAQWMNHAALSAVGRDCVSCHAADALASAWSTATPFHAAVGTVSLCGQCHGLSNGGGSVVATNNNMPAGLTDSTTVSSASVASGVPAGTHDQILHADINVVGHDCAFCHTQQGPSTTAGISGVEWAQATFHVQLSAASPLVTNGTSGRCANCHVNVKPSPSFTTPDHSPFNNATGSQDCSACHAWPGKGTRSAPNWLVP